jgi:hypothetical protein
MHRNYNRDPVSKHAKSPDLAMGMGNSIGYHPGRFLLDGYPLLKIKMEKEGNDVILPIFKGGLRAKYILILAKLPQFYHYLY